MDRRMFLAGAALAASASRAATSPLDLRRIDHDRIVRAANRYLDEPPVTLTAFPAARSPAGPHDYYSEADYWWPDPKRPDGPYVRRDGYSNPAKFTAHRDALIRLGVQAPALIAAFVVTGEARYADHAQAHLRAWFVEPATRMNPHLEHAQAIIGVNTGRGIGVIDTLHLVEVARAASVLGQMRPSALVADEVPTWFDRYLTWMTTSPNGIDEREQVNNHGSCWALQCAEFARLAKQPASLALARQRIKALIPGQIARDGSQPLELARTKPFGYSLFNLDVLAACAHILSRPGDDLWRFRGASGGSIADAVAYMAPFIADKSLWPKAPDVEAWDGWPVRHPALLFAGQALDRPAYIELWKSLPADPVDDEIVRNYPIRQPVLWTTA